jgi:hypothetical protein
VKTRNRLLLSGALLLTLAAAVAVGQEDPSVGEGPARSPHDKPGFATELADTLLWVLAEGQTRSAAPETLVGAGPLGLTLVANDRTTALTYLATRPGFRCRVEGEDVRIWQVTAGELPPATPASRADAGPLGTTLHAPDEATLILYLTGQ